MINYHIVFCPKFRKQILLDNIRADLAECLKVTAITNKWEILGLEIMPDHVHLFLTADTRTAPETVVRKFKGASSRHLRRICPRLRRMPGLWTRSYFISTAGNVSSETIMNYIQGQWRRWGK
jgi:putative transposase